ncbi:hypothetical protein HNR53_003972 [Bacillus benzoevorans]|uniref:Uncharacterized protein n=1 Tax=Bacillus benzoevorans TaxID=1456 RepID=A0A7X0HUU2_9BACI|nr:hypothetical protein [Bacillus benzoevorans]
MTMNLVGQQKLFEVPSPLKYEGEDIVYSMIERHSGKASQPTNKHKEFYNLFVNFKLSERDFSTSNIPFFI